MAYMYTDHVRVRNKRVVLRVRFRVTLINFLKITIHRGSRVCSRTDQVTNKDGWVVWKGDKLVKHDPSELC